MIKLQAGTSPSFAVQVLADAARDIQNARGHAGSTYSIGLFNMYLAWANTYVRTVAGLVSEDELDNLITSKRYWVLQSLDPSSVDQGVLRQFVDFEINQRIERLTSAQDSLVRELNLWVDGKTTALVIDTNVWLRYNETIAERDWHHMLGLSQDDELVIAVPMQVIDELDRNKVNRKDPPKGQEPVRNQARKSLRFLEGRLDSGIKRVSLRDATDDLPELHLSLISQPLDHVPLLDADLEIVDRALTVQPYAKDVRLITFDYGMMFRARQAGLTVTRLEGEEG